MKRVDEKTIEGILKEYQSEEELFFPEETELDERQEQFIKGYLRAQQKNKGTFETEEEVRQQILQVRSKYCEPILDLLFQEGELYHGDLADKLELSPSGLNAIIKKMVESTPPIIEMMQIGKYKIYFLPDAVRKYMDNRNQPKESRKPDHRMSEGNLLLSLQHFVEIVNGNWKDELNLLLQGENTEAEDNICRSFQELMELTKQAEEYDRTGYDQLKKAMGNDVLSFLLDEYMEEIRECNSILEEIRQRENGEKLIRHFKMQ
ncbi:MAG: winged helix-turn-helix domain-containing protein [Lachnospiraceae bacterium]